MFGLRFYTNKSFFLGLVLFTSPAWAKANDQTAHFVLQKVLDVTAELPPVMMDLEVSQFHAADYAAERNAGTQQKIRLFKRGEAFDVVTDLRVRAASDAKGAFKPASKNRIIWDTTRSFVRRTMGQEVKGYLRNAKPSMAWRTRAPYLHGVLDYGSSHFAHALLDSSEEAKLRPQKESIDGSPCLVIEGAVNNKHYTVWIDPDQSYLPRKAVVKEILNPPMEIPENGKMMRSRTFEMGGVKIDEIEGRYVLTEARQIVHNAYTDGTTDEDRHDVKVTVAKWNPDFEGLGAFKMDLPEGTIIDDMDLAIKYEWQAGKLVAAVDQEAINQIESTVLALKTQRNQISQDPVSAATEEIAANPLMLTGAPLAEVAPSARSKGKMLGTLVLGVLVVVGIAGILRHRHVRGV